VLEQECVTFLSPFILSSSHSAQQQQQQWCVQQQQQQQHTQAMKLDVNVLRYLSKEDFRVLTAVEMGQKNVRVATCSQSAAAHCGSTPPLSGSGSTAHGACKPLLIDITFSKLPFLLLQQTQV
jgi:hypothetical protein